MGPQFNLFRTNPPVHNVSLAQEKVLGRMGERQRRRLRHCWPRSAGGQDGRVPRAPFGRPAERVAIARALAMPARDAVRRGDHALDPDADQGSLDVMRELASEG